MAAIFIPFNSSTRTAATSSIRSNNPVSLRSNPTDTFSGRNSTSTVATTINSSNKWAAPLRTIEESTNILNDPRLRLEELLLCWREPKTKNEGVNLINKKNLAGLEKALKKTSSRISRLSIGWKHGGNRKALIQLLQLFITHSNLPSLKNIDSIELVLGEWIPDTILLQLLLPYAPNLEHLHIQATRMKVKTPKTKEFKNVYQSVHAVQYLLQEESVATLFAKSKLTSQLKYLSSLALIDCDVLDDDIDVLVKFLWHHAASTKYPLEALSVRSNRHLSPGAIQKICQAPVTKRLDLSLCDLRNSGAKAVARALTTENEASWRQCHGVILEELHMSGNYQLDGTGLVALAEVCPYQTLHWNLSYCDMNEYQTQQLLQTLTPALVPLAGDDNQSHSLGPSTVTAPLQKLILQGAKINNVEACQALGGILRSNRSLTHLVLDDPKYPSPLSMRNFALIVQGLEHNYGLKELALDLHALKRQEQLLGTTGTAIEEARRIRSDMEFYLLLNQAGRKMLQNENQFDQDAWMDALMKARLMPRRADVVYWLLRNSVVHLF